MSKQIAENILDNAYQFAKRAAEDLCNKDYKFSLIHFCSSIEQVFKARLVLDHWMLIIDKNDIDKATINAFSKGELKTVSISSALKRSQNLYKNVKKIAVNELTDLFKERNKLIHLFNSNFQDVSEQDKVIKLIHCSWYLVHKIINTTVKFDAYKEKFNLIDKELKKFKEYLEAIYQDKEQELKKLENQNIDVFHCAMCGHRSMCGNQKSRNINHGGCLVCDNAEYYIKILCASCDQVNYLDNSTCENYGFQCNNCKSELNWDKNKALNDLEGFSDDPKHGYFYASCSSCGTTESVGFIDDKTLICTNCLCVPDNFAQCEFCSEFYTDRKDDSYLTGCGHCGGRLGYEGL